MKTLSWGMVGGGEGSQIGPAHRVGARLDGLFSFDAAALDYRPAEGIAFAQTLGISKERAYGSWQDMLAGEKDRTDPIDLVTIATPNNTHFEIAMAFVLAGFHVLLEKPITMTVQEGEELVHAARSANVICAVNYGYTGYPLVRQMKAMIKNGDIGKVRLVVAEFAHGHHSNAADADNPRVRWRYDPKQAGVSAQFADCGIHALHMASFVTGQEVERLSADLASCIASRVLEDDAQVNFRMSGGAVGRLWTSSIALGRQHGLTLQVFGETGGLRWAQEQPNQIFYTPLSGRTQIIERGEEGLYPEEVYANRVTVGHAEGMPLAFANIYKDLSENIRARKDNRTPDPASLDYPKVEDGLRSMAAIFAVAQSGASAGSWLDARPPMFQR